MLIELSVCHAQFFVYDHSLRMRAGGGGGAVTESGIEIGTFRSLKTDK